MPGNNRPEAPQQQVSTPSWMEVRKGIIDAPKPPEILAEEKRLGGKELEPIYAKGDAGGGRGGNNIVEYGAPIGYRYDNGNSEYVNFDASGKYQGTVKRQSGIDPAMLAILAMPFLGPMAFEALGLTGAGAGAAGAGALGAGAAFTPEMIAAGLAPGSIGAAGAASGALTGANLAAASGIGSLGAGAAAIPSINEMIASGMSPGSAGAAGAAEGLLTAEQLAAATGASGAGITSLAPAAAKSVNEMIASGMSPGSAGAAGAASGALTPAQLAAASGVTTAGATPALVELANAGKGLPSVNEAVASGLGPGSAGADLASKGLLTAEELAAAAGTAGTAGSLGKLGISDLLNAGKLLALGSVVGKGLNDGGGSGGGTSTIPEFTANRTQLAYDVDKKGVNPNTPYRPGQGGVTYFSPITYTPKTPKAAVEDVKAADGEKKVAGGGLMSLGGMSNLGSYSDGGRLLQGPGDGVSDSIPAIIGKKQPARLANGEFVIPARIVSELGNGSTDAGAKRLYEMMDRIQKVRRKTKNVAANTKAAKYLPA